VLQNGRQLTVKPVNLVVQDPNDSGSESEGDDYDSEDVQYGVDGQDNSCGQDNSIACEGNDEPVSELNSIASVGVAEMDEEHGLCAGALDQLQRTRSLDALEQVLQIYQLHFRHEEQFLDKWLYTDQQKSASEGFNADASARRTHFADHARMIRAVKDQIQLMRSQPNATLKPNFVSQVLRDFEEHADRYDGSYAERMSSAIDNAKGLQQSVQSSACVAGG
jgi:hemerythrin